jgi:RNA polymerase sigma factor (sigma-70 family)
MKINPADIRILIHIVTRKTGSPVHDEDLEQDVALNALEAFRRLNVITHPKALLMKIVHDTVRDHWRRRRTSEDLNDLDERFLSHARDAELEFDRKRRVALLQRAIAELPASKRQLIHLFYVQDLSISEIAEIQSRSVSAIKMDLARSRRSLRKIIGSSATKKSR